MLQAWHHKPIDSTRVETGQPSFRGRVRCQSHLVAWERRRREPGSNSVSDTASLTGCEGHVVRLGGVRRTRKIFVWLSGNPPHLGPVAAAIRNAPALRLLVTGSIHYTIKIASAASKRRRHKSKIVLAHKTGPNTAPAFSRVYNIPSFPRRRESREKQSTPFTPFAKRRGRGSTPSFPRGLPRTPIRGREPREKQSTPINIPSPSMGALHN